MADWEKEAFRQMIKMIAMKEGVPVNEVLQWPLVKLDSHLREYISILMEKLDSHLREYVSILHLDAREEMRMALVEARMTILMENAQVPEEMTLEDSIVHGYLTKGEVEDLMEVTDAEVDASMGNA